MTSPAQGIHDHPTLKLGARTGRLRSNTPALPFRQFLRVVPQHPIVDAAPGFAYPMDKNDVAGDCVVAGLDHALQVIYELLGVPRSNWTDAQILAFYQTQNPGFRDWSDAEGPDDQGMDIQAFLSYLVKQGLILGFAAVDPTDQDTMKAAIYLGLAVVTGEDLRAAQQSQGTWDYVAGSPDWGGHCTCSVGFPGLNLETAVTWGALKDMTQAFVSKQMSEAYFVVTQAHVDHPAFREGFDLVKFGEAFTSLTGRDFPVVIPEPEPTPDPGPVPPQPVPAPTDVDRQLADAARSWLSRILHSHAQTVALRGALTDWMDVHYPSNGDGGRHRD